MKVFAKIILIVLFISLFIPISLYGVSQVFDNPSTAITEDAFQSNFSGVVVRLAQSEHFNLSNSLAVPHTAAAAANLSVQISRNLQSIDTPGDKFVLGSTFILEEGEVLEGNLFVLGGTATLEAESLVERDVVLMGGTVEINGTVEGEVIGLGGLLILGPTAVIENDVTIVVGHLDRSSGAEVYGEVNDGIKGLAVEPVPGVRRIPIPGGENFPAIRITSNPFWESLWVLFRSLLMAALAVLAVLFMPKQTGRVGGVAIKQAPVSGGLGCLTTIILPIALIITAVTIIGIPITILVAITFVVIVLFGMIAIGTETGVRLGKMLHTDWALAVSAGIGTFLLTIVVEGLRWIIPCIGFVALGLVAFVGIGAVLLTRFGTREYPTYVEDEGIEGPELAPIEITESIEAPPPAVDDQSMEDGDQTPPTRSSADSNSGDTEEAD